MQNIKETIHMQPLSVYITLELSHCWIFTCIIICSRTTYDHCKWI